MGKKNADQEEKSLSEEEAIRLKILAEKKFNSSNLSSALKYAERAHRLCPAVEGVSEMAATFRILHAAENAANSDSDTDWYRILDLDPFSNINSIKKQYKRLALILHPDKNSLEASGEAFKLVNDAFQVLSDRVRRKELDMKLRVALQAEAAAVEETDEAAKDTFLTNCSRCRLLHKFDRKYIEQSLVCPSCRKSFKALEVVPEEEESGSRKSSKIRFSSEKNTNSGVKRKNCNLDDVSDGKSMSMNGTEVEEQMTLAEMKLKLKKKTEGNKKSKVREENSNKEERLLNLRNGDMEVMEVENSDFYDFDRDRAERSFKNGQVWAIYDDDDGMPRHYGLIEEVVSINPFEVKMSWLNLHNNDDQSWISWEKMGFHVSCGRFKASRKDKINLVNVFSHTAKCERVAREMYRIYPHKGSVWALYKEGNCSNRYYEIVVFLTSYSEMHGISMVYLEKVDGFRTVFRRKDVGHRAVRWIEKFDFRQFSHQIPARKLCDDDDNGVPDHLKSCWELDPAALPPDLLAVEPRVKKV
ncbi:hypothetical protein V2J09_004737 [Rumex salicifolius]